MTQRLSPHPLSPSMGEQSLSQSAATAAAAAAAADDNHLPPSAAAAAAAKIAFRPRKLRKISPDGDAAAAAPGGETPVSRQIILRVLPRPLTADGELAAALRHLRAADPLLARVIDTHEPPHFQSTYPPFHSLTRSILQQQLSIKASNSIYARFISLCGGASAVAPETVLSLTPFQLRQIGVSARKATYLHDLARKFHTGILSDAAIVAMDDKSLFSMLTMVKGIGAWSVHMFMIFSLHRPDVLPVGDLGIRKGVQMLYGLDEVPRPSQMEQTCLAWRPYRSVGACYMLRLVETKGAPPIAPADSGGMHISHGGEAAALHSYMQQPLLMDPIQMLPNMG